MVEDELQQKLKKMKTKGDDDGVVVEDDMSSSLFDLDDDSLEKAPGVVQPMVTPASKAGWLDPVMKGQAVLGNNRNAGASFHSSHISFFGSFVRSCTCDLTTGSQLQLLLTERVSFVPSSCWWLVDLRHQPWSQHSCRSNTKTT